MVKTTNEMGYTAISNSVFTSLAGAAATNCFGVKGMAMRSYSDGIVHLLKKEAMGKGVRVTAHDDNTISIHLHIVVEYGVNISEITKSMISEVRYKVHSATGVDISSVDVFIDSMIVNN